MTTIEVLQKNLDFTQPSFFSREPIASVSPVCRLLISSLSLSFQFFPSSLLHFFRIVDEGIRFHTGLVAEECVWLFAFLSLLRCWYGSGFLWILICQSSRRYRFVWWLPLHLFYLPLSSTADKRARRSVAGEKFNVVDFGFCASATIASIFRLTNCTTHSSWRLSEHRFAQLQHFSTIRTTHCTI